MQKVQISKSQIAEGLGVFAATDIKKGEIIEECPLLLVPMDEFNNIKKTKLYYYYFEYTNSHFAIALGYGSLYNHSYNPNARYLYNFKKKVLIIKSRKLVKKGTEVTINYNYYPTDKTPLSDWFKEKVAASK